MVVTITPSLQPAQYGNIGEGAEETGGEGIIAVGGISNPGGLFTDTSLGPRSPLALLKCWDSPGSQPGPT